MGCSWTKPSEVNILKVILNITSQMPAMGDTTMVVLTAIGVPSHLSSLNRWEKPNIWKNMKGKKDLITQLWIHNGFLNTKSSTTHSVEDQGYMYMYMYVPTVTHVGYMYIHTFMHSRSTASTMTAGKVKALTTLNTRGAVIHTRRLKHQDRLEVTLQRMNG